MPQKQIGRDRRKDLLDAVARVAWPPARPEDGSKRFVIPLEIATLRVDLWTRSDSLARRVRDYFAGYLATERSAPPIGELYADPLPGKPWIWEDEDPEFDVRGASVVQRDFAARFVAPGEEGTTRAVALMAPEVDDAFHNLLRWFFPRLLLRAGAFLMHGAGVVRDGRGYVFFGQSGAGKSTTASLIADADPSALLLGDDSVIVAIGQDGVARAHAAPFGCGYSRLAPPPVSAPLAGLYALEQAGEHRVEPLASAPGAATLLASAMNVSFEHDAEERLELALRFAATAPRISRMRFSRDAGFWSLLRRRPRRTTLNAFTGGP